MSLPERLYDTEMAIINSLKPGMTARIGDGPIEISCGATRVIIPLGKDERAVIEIYGQPTKEQWERLLIHMRLVAESMKPPEEAS